MRKHKKTSVIKHIQKHQIALYIAITGQFTHITLTLITGPHQPTLPLQRYTNNCLITPGILTLVSTLYIKLKNMRKHKKLCG